MTETREPTQMHAPNSTTGRVAGVLLAFSRAGSPLRVTDIAEHTGLPKSVAHRILNDLAGYGLIERDTASRAYRLGSGAFALANAAERQSTFKRLAQPVMAGLANKTEETVTLSILNGYQRIYLDQIESPHRVRISVSIGSSIPITVGASGLALLSGLPDDEISELLQRPVEQHTRLTETRPEEILQRIELTRARGYSHSAGERVADSVSCAAPVFGVFDRVIGCVSVGIVASRAPEERVARIGALVSEAGKKMTAMILSHAHVGVEAV